MPVVYVTSSTRDVPRCIELPDIDPAITTFTDLKTRIATVYPEQLPPSTISHFAFGAVWSNPTAFLIDGTVVSEAVLKAKADRDQEEEETDDGINLGLVTVAEERHAIEKSVYACVCQQRGFVHGERYPASFRENGREAVSKELEELEKSRQEVREELLALYERDHRVDGIERGQTLGEGRAPSDADMQVWIERVDQRRGVEILKKQKMREERDAQYRQQQEVELRRSAEEQETTAEPRTPSPVEYYVPVKGKHWAFSANTTQTTMMAACGDMKECAFSVTSGELLWGHLHTIFDGAHTEKHDANAESRRTLLEGGTILQRRLNYRAAARKGDWKVSKACHNTTRDRNHPTGPPTSFLGYSIHHTSIEPVATLERASLIGDSDGLSLHNNHVDKDVLYINRYDFGHHYKPTDRAALALGLEAAGLEELPDAKVDLRSGGMVEDMKAGRHAYGGFFAVVDASAYAEDETGVLRCLADYEKQNVDGGEQALLKKASTVGAVRTCMSVAHSEYELAWLVFSGRKHVDFPASDELVAIIYDGSYTSLDGDKFAVDLA